MATPSYIIVPTTKPDIPTLAKLLCDSKLQLTINRLLFKDWPNEAAQLQNYTRAVEGAFANPDNESFKVVDSEGEIVGHLTLTRIRPGKLNVATEPKGDQKVPDYFNPEIFAWVMRTVGEINEDFKEIDRYELTHVYVKDSSRRQGIGSDLVKLCLDKAKAEGLPLIMNTEPGAHEFFAKLGFNETKHSDIDLSKYAPPYTGFGLFRLTGMYVSA